jgi:hypothetical protein
MAAVAVMATIIGSMTVIMDALNESHQTSLLFSLLPGPIVFLFSIVFFLVAGASLWGISETETRYQNFDQYEVRVREKWGLPVDVEDKPTEISGGAPPQALIDDNKARPERLKPSRKGE